MRSTEPSAAALLAAAAVTLGAAEPPEPAARLELVTTRGALDGTGAGFGDSASWETLSLELRLRNHLGVAVGDIELDVELLAGAETPKPIPGWRFSAVPLDLTLDAGSERRVELRRRLPDLRRPPRAEDVSYKVRIHAYRVMRPGLGLAFRLLGSAAPSDQRAALRMFLPGPGIGPEARERLRRDLSATLRTLPEEPTATDALRMLLAIRAIGTLGLDEEVDLLLSLPDRTDKEAWGRAVLELASRMVVASQPDDPRLDVLPRWARRVATLLQVTARDALLEATREAVARIGEAALPALVRATGPDRPEAVRARARALLERLGRATPRSQVLFGDLEVRARTMRALAAIGATEAVPALVEALAGPEEAAFAARRALLTLGASAVGPVAETLGRSDDGPRRTLLTELGRRHPGALRAVARLYRVEGWRRRRPEEIVAAISDRRAWERSIRVETRIREAIELGAEGAFRSALERIEGVRKEDPERYAFHADPIARLHLARAEQLLERGDYRAALDVLDVGRRLRALPEIEMRTTDARAALASGFLRLGELAQAETELERAPVTGRADVVELRARLLEAKARAALEAGDLFRARIHVRQARSLEPERVSLRLLERRIFLAEHFVEAIVLGGCGLGLALLFAVLTRRVLDRRRVEALTRALDRGQSSASGAPIRAGSSPSAR